MASERAEARPVSLPAAPAPSERAADDYALPFQQLSAAMVMLRGKGASAQLVAATKTGLALLLGTADARLPARPPLELWSACEGVPLGETCEWRPAERPDVSILCTRYSQGDDGYLLVLRESSAKPDVLSQRLHRQRLEITGRLVAMIAHDLRVPLSSIVFNADVAYERQLSPEELALTLADIRTAAGRMRQSIDGLLDFARIGGKASVVALGDVFSRVESLLRPQMRDGGHALEVQLDPQASWVRGNPLVVEQALVNLLLNAMEASNRAVQVRVSTARIRATEASASRRATRPGEDFSCLIVEDDGPGVPLELRERIFQPFFTTKPEGTGLGLPMAREALATIDAGLTLEPSPRGARFAVWFPWLAPPLQPPASVPPPSPKERGR